MSGQGTKEQCWCWGLGFGEPGTLGADPEAHRLVSGFPRSRRIQPECRIRVLNYAGRVRKGLFAPGTFQHARILTRRVKLEMKLGRAERGEIALALLALENLVGETEIGAYELIGKHFARRRGGEQSVQAKGAAEDGFVVSHAPLAKLGLYAGGRVLDQQARKALKTDAMGKGGLIAIGEFQTLLNPARQILADIIEHSKL